MSFTLDTVKELREKTQAGMMDCKRALEASGGDLDAAVEYLRKKGLATAAKKAGRIAAEGVISAANTSDGKFFVLVEVNCETDFVVKTDDFQNYAANLAKIVLEKKPQDVDALHELMFDGKKVKDYQTELVAKVGENINVRRFSSVSINGNEKVAQYMHMGSKIGVLVRFYDPNSKLDDQTAKEIAMHVAAMNPSYISREDVPSDVVEKEKDIFREQMAAEKKPPEIMEKILVGKLNKQLGEMCLEDQIFVKDLESKNSVKNILKKIDSGIKIKEFVRLQVGEGIEKKEKNLAEEVASMIQ